MAVLDIVAGALTVIVTVAFLAWLIRQARGGYPERHAEEDARDFFTLHGRWPDE